MVTRRGFLGTLVAAVVALVVPGIATPKVAEAIPTLKAIEGYRIEQILPTAFPALRDALLNGHPWMSSELNVAHASGRVRIAPLGAYVQVIGDDAVYEVQEVSVPLMWTENDNRNNTEAQRIELVRGMVTNAMEMIDDIILERMGSGRIVVSKQYRYDLGEVYQLEHRTAYTARLYSAVAFLPA